MKATIVADGRMTIRAETDIEQYALSKWYEDWLERKVIFQIEIAAEHEPNVKEYKQVIV